MSNLKYLFQINGPFWSIGFRPFFFFSMLYSMVLVFLWVGVFTGWMSPIYSMGLKWHVHEMIYGVVLGVISGFILTASSNWTGIPPIGGPRLLYLVVLWGLARIGAFYNLESSFSVILQFLFIWRLLVSLWPYLFPKGKRRNQIFAYLLAVLGLSQVGFVMVPKWPASWLTEMRLDYLALGAITMVVVVIAGRVIPMFTRNALGCEVRQRPRIQLLSIVLVGLSFCSLSYFGIESVIVSGLFLALGSVLGFNYSGWGGRASLSSPLAWSLHLGFIWIILGALYIGASPLLGVPTNLGFHMLTFGGISGVIFAMISRVSLGHTGHPLKASKAVVAGYYALHIGVVCRAVLPLVDMQHYSFWLNISGACWVVAFALLFFDNAGRLLGPRADARL